MSDSQRERLQLQQTRRAVLGRSTASVGAIALGTLLRPDAARAATATEDASSGDSRSQGVVNPRHYPPRATRIIHLYMAGGPSHLETFDHKPVLGM